MKLQCDNLGIAGFCTTPEATIPAKQLQEKEQQVGPNCQRPLIQGTKYGKVWQSMTQYNFAIFCKLFCAEEEEERKKKKSLVAFKWTGQSQPSRPLCYRHHNIVPRHEPNASFAIDEFFQCKLMSFIGQFADMAEGKSQKMPKAPSFYTIAPNQTGRAARIRLAVPTDMFQHVPLT